jgi:hypothetical protein
MKKANALIISISFIFLLQLLVLTIPAFAADWFVRPYGATYGAGNGTSWTNAWAGLDKVVWGRGGVQAGDTLWIGGVHGDLGSGYIGTHTLLTVGAAGANGKPVTIRGDCSSLDPSYTDGIIYRTQRRFTTGWEDTGINGVKKISLYGGCGSVYEDRTLMNRTPVRCSSPPLLTELAAFQPGDWYNDHSSVYLYAKPQNGGDPNTHVYLINIGDAAIIIASKDYISIKNISIYGGFVSLTSARQVVIDKINVSNAYYGVSAYGSCDNLTVRNCSIDMVGNGIYLIMANGLYTNNSLIERNIITNVQRIGNGVGAPDQHAIGIQDGLNHIARYNQIKNAATAVTGYGDTGVHDFSMDVYGNYAEDIYRLGTGFDANPSSAHGCAFDYHGPSTGKITIKIYNNIANKVENSGIRVAPSPDATIYNNILDKCNIGIYTSCDSMRGILNKADIRNNIITNTTDYGRGLPVVFQYMVSDEYPYPTNFVSDYNCYYPNATDKNIFFNRKFSSSPMSMASWAANIGNQEIHTQTLSPQYVNKGGNYNLPSDFEVSLYSPAILSGIDVGLTQDLAGNPIIPVGSSVDMGSYQISSPDPLASTTPPPTCTYSISPTGKSFSSSGGSGTINVTSVTNCKWTAVANASWVTITAGTGGIGKGIVNFKVAKNSNKTSRNAVIAVADQQFSVAQAQR